MPPTLGQRLKHAREQRGLTLCDVAHKTRIPAARLQDLEDDKLNTFGGMTYARSFLRTYATLLDVDASEVLHQIKPPPLGGPRDYSYLVKSLGPWISKRYESRAHGARASQLTAGNTFLLAAAVCLIFGLFIGGAVLANAYLNSKTATAAASKDAASAAASPAPAPAAPAPSGPAPWSSDPFAEEPSLSPSGVGAAKQPAATPGTGPAPIKAQPVEEARRALPVAPKAEAVR
jgi:cytoskeleton protein RodZ